MAKIVAATFVKPVPAEKANPYIEDLKPFAEAGVDTAFAIETTAAEYASEKLLIQKAMNAHGFSAREVVKPDAELSGSSKVSATFLVRPQRKAKAEAEAAEAEQPAE